VNRPLPYLIPPSLWGRPGRGARGKRMSSTHAQSRTAPPPTPPHKWEGKTGPLVWRDMDQQALDRAYDQAVYAPNRDQVLGRIAAASERARKVLGPPQRMAYGPSQPGRLD